MGELGVRTNPRKPDVYAVIKRKANRRQRKRSLEALPCSAVVPEALGTGQDAMNGVRGSTRSVEMRENAAYTVN